MVDMVSDGVWQVLVEEESKNTWGEDDHRWGLAARHPARDAANAHELAESLARSYVPSLLSERKPYRRLVYRLGRGAWLVALESHSGTLHVRIGVAELVEVIDHQPPKRRTLKQFLDPE
ncbi:hypothetical protein [Streptomyces sp. BE303]|uniref:hypothetical protein n=1 Tax=Streptomyces sp. BE303 TaxID=3002528 RepID=UPI002E7A0D5E|nr:hypothetical protein [Streptomyces sp. BE303]MED7951544.1 hypothetical protein [Streptomyces sp. BE303]